MDTAQKNTGPRRLRSRSFHHRTHSHVVLACLFAVTLGQRGTGAQSVPHCNTGLTLTNAQQAMLSAWFTDLVTKRPVQPKVAKLETFDETGRRTYDLDLVGCFPLDYQGAGALLRVDCVLDRVRLGSPLAVTPLTSRHDHRTPAGVKCGRV